MARKFSRIARVAAAGIAVALSLTACGSSGSGGNDKFKVGFMAYDIGLDPFVSAMVEEAKKEAEAKGIELDIRNGGNDLSKQISAVQDFITQGDDAIIVYPGDPEGIGPMVKQASAKGIPVFSVNLSLAEGIPVTTFVGANDKEYGEKQGQMLVDAIREQGKVGLIMGALGTSAQLLRTEGLKEVLASHPGIQIVEQQADGWQSDKTLALTQDWVTKYPKGQLDAIVVQGPEAMGAIRWARDQGRDDIKWVLGDYPTDLVQPIKDGLVFGTVSQDPAQQGREVVDAAFNWLSGNTSAVKTPALYTPLPIVTKANVNQMKPVFGL
jgi:ABC-type sugar transport system substrate-binding protein